MARLATGDKMPNFTFDTAYENGKTIEAVLKDKKRTIFWVLRYIGCPTCRYDVHMLAMRYQEFLDLDTQIFVVMQSEPVNVRNDLKDTQLPFSIICDTDMEIYHTLEIPVACSKEERMPKLSTEIARLEEKRKEVKALGFVHGKYEGNEQQLPALFLIEDDSTVRYVHYAKHSIDMPAIDEVLNLLKNSTK